MKKMTQLAAAIALASGALVATPAMAEDKLAVSANAGFVTEYYYRGQELGDAGAYGGVDAEFGGFYAGMWAIDDGNDTDDGGLEVDFYAGYGFEFENGLSLGLGYTRYEYTYSSVYEDEWVLSAGFKGFAVEYANGEDNNDDKDDDLYNTVDEEYDYDFWAVSYSGDIFGIKYGSYEADLDTVNAKNEYDYIEISASGEVVGLDVSATLGKKRNVKVNDGTLLQDEEGSGDGYFVIDVSKSFDLM
ncbi:hypothetical protein R50073_48070 [Maricurvus nonylphenolicus]|uniref:TorF family putative porin n=1 Tax=Maricurvus nonylphenolicus TaxID=1008307 RepID=UPI0036F38A10